MLGVALFASAVSTATMAIPNTLGARLAFEGELARGVLTRRYVEVSGCETVDVPFEKVEGLLAGPDALGRLLAAYTRRLPRAEQVARSLTREAPGVYRYDTEDGDPTQVRELHRGRTDGGMLEAVYFSRGRRFFGDFSALIRVVAWPEGNHTRYRLWVFAYPENALLRFAARNLGLAGRFFRSKSAELCRMASEVIPEAAALPPSIEGSGRRGPDARAPAHRAEVHQPVLNGR